MAAQHCFGAHPIVGEGFAVSSLSKPLLEPVLACAAHVGDLLGNVAKSATRFDPTVPVDIRVARFTV